MTWFSWAYKVNIYFKPSTWYTDIVLSIEQVEKYSLLIILILLTKSLWTLNYFTTFASDIYHTNKNFLCPVIKKSLLSCNKEHGNSLFIIYIIIYKYEFNFYMYYFT